MMEVVPFWTYTCADGIKRRGAQEIYQHKDVHTPAQVMTSQRCRHTSDNSVSSF